MLITVPYAFDTTAIWGQIVKFVVALTGVLLLGILVGLMQGKFGGAIGLAISMAILFWMVRRVRAWPMGAAGTLTATDVTTHPVRVFWYSLPVPVGRFSLDRFESIAVVEHVIMLQPGGGWRNAGSVQLVGKSGTPDIEVARGHIDEAMAIGEAIGTLLRLPWRRIDAPESRTARVMLR